MIKRTQKIISILIITFSTCLLGGCPPETKKPEPMKTSAHRLEALSYLKKAVQYKENPAIRMAGIEALELSNEKDTLEWIRTGLYDDHPGVRFAACVVLGNKKDNTSIDAIRTMLDDKDTNVRLAAQYALHRLGDHSFSNNLPEYLLSNDDVLIRRNAALLLGNLNNDGLVMILARAMKDRDQGVQQHALEAMAKLGNKQAREQLTAMCYSGVGSDEVFALNALVETKDPRYLDLFRSKYKEENTPHVEIRLAATRGMAILDDYSGKELALKSLDYKGREVNDPNDPAEEKILRVKLLACLALGEMKDSSILSPLVDIMKNEKDPRLQVAAARSIVLIAKSINPEPLSFPISKPISSP